MVNGIFFIRTNIQCLNRGYLALTRIVYLDEFQKVILQPVNKSVSPQRKDHVFSVQATSSGKASETKAD